MSCEVCQFRFNLTNRYPLCLPCCNETICQECKQQIADARQQTIFQCPIDECRELNSCDTKFNINKFVKKLLRESLSIYCDSHPNELAEFYCLDHETVVCQECSTDNHDGHNIQKISKKMISDYHVIIMDKLEAQYRRIGKLITTFEGYQKDQMQFTATKYLKKIKKAQEILTLGYEITRRKRSDQVLKCGSSTYLTVSSLIDSKSLSYTYVFEALSGNQLILTSIVYQSKMKIFNSSKNVLDKNVQIAITVQRKQRHNQCKSLPFQMRQSRTYTLPYIKIQHNKVFGGYASVSWNSPQQFVYLPDENAFIISLTHKTKHVQYKNQQYAVFHNSQNYPTFGMSCDIYLYDGTFCSYLGNTYSLPKGMQINTDEAKTYLVGSFYFDTVEIEVFKVIFTT